MITLMRLRPLSQRSLSFAVMLLVAAGVLAASPARALAGPNEGDFFSAANSARSSAGLSAYAWASDLAAVARGQADRMAASGQLEHNPNLATEISNWQGLAENIGEGTGWGAIQQAFMNSPEHRGAILDSGYTQMGVGTAVDKNGTLWVSEVFRLPAGATTSVPNTSGGGNSSPTTTGTTAGTTSTVPTTTVSAGPTPTQILRSKIQHARKKISTPKTKQRRRDDPLVAALKYSTVMDTVGG